jgi:hypothetical protein
VDRRLAYERATDGRGLAAGVSVGSLSQAALPPDSQGGISLSDLSNERKSGKCWLALLRKLFTGVWCILLLEWVYVTVSRVLSFSSIDMLQSVGGAVA